jgi:hypothetical protein
VSAYRKRRADGEKMRRKEDEMMRGFEKMEGENREIGETGGN